MRWALPLLCVVALAGCTRTLTEAEARAVCEAAGASEEQFNEFVDFATDDRDDGLSREESLDLFEGDCEDDCVDDQDCFNDCFSCATAIVDYVY